MLCHKLANLWLKSKSSPHKCWLRSCSSVSGKLLYPLLFLANREAWRLCSGQILRKQTNSIFNHFGNNKTPIVLIPHLEVSIIPFTDQIKLLIWPRHSQSTCIRPDGTISSLLSDTLLIPKPNSFYSPLLLFHLLVLTCSISSSDKLLFSVRARGLRIDLDYLISFLRGLRLFLCVNH